MNTTTPKAVTKFRAFFRSECGVMAYAVTYTSPERRERGIKREAKKGYACTGKDER